jgi:2-dehydro-3-deoxyphosphogluconate aldolase/(4S)-4-hydroxy-2-oxoglutarate aldolase
MIPTGGVSLTTAGDFLKAGASAVAVGGELVDGKNVKEGNFAIFTERAKRFLDVVRAARAEMKA